MHVRFKPQIDFHPNYELPRSFRVCISVICPDWYFRNHPKLYTRIEFCYVHSIEKLHFSMLTVASLYRNNFSATVNNTVHCTCCQQFPFELFPAEGMVCVKTVDSLISYIVSARRLIEKTWASLQPVALIVTRSYLCWSDWILNLSSFVRQHSGKPVLSWLHAAVSSMQITPWSIPAGLLSYCKATRCAWGIT